MKPGPRPSSCQKISLFRHCVTELGHKMCSDVIFCRCQEGRFSESGHFKVLANPENFVGKSGPHTYLTMRHAARFSNKTTCVWGGYSSGHYRHAWTPLSKKTQLTHLGTQIECLRLPPGVLSCSRNENGPKNMKKLQVVAEKSQKDWRERSAHKATPIDQRCR